MNDSINCPVDFVAVNEYKVRLIALAVLILAIVFIVSGAWWLIVLLVIDFFLRSFKLGNYSPLSIFAGWIVKTLHIKNKPVDQAPKRFAARIGFGFNIAILALYFLQFNNAALAVAAVLCLFAFLESFLSFCAGCYVYTFYYKLFPKGTSDNIV